MSGEDVSRWYPYSGQWVVLKIIFSFAHIGTKLSEFLRARFCNDQGWAYLQNPSWKRIRSNRGMRKEDKRFKYRFRELSYAWTKSTRILLYEKIHTFTERAVIYSVQTCIFGSLRFCACSCAEEQLKQVSLRHSVIHTPVCPLQTWGRSSKLLYVKLMTPRLC